VDLSKYPLERIFYLLAGVIPGFTALLIFDLKAPGSFHWFFSLGFLGYKVKLALVVVAAFLVGITITNLLNGILGAIGGGIVGVKSTEPYQHASSYEVAPWRDGRWRIAVKKRLGANAPNDTSLLTENLLGMRRQAIDDFRPAEERPEAHAALKLEKLNTEIDDGKWAQWYDFYHQAVIERDQREFHSTVRRGLNFNLEATAIYVLVSAIFLPKLRHWWCVVPCVVWVLILVAEQRTDFNRYINKWSTVDAQIEYLSERSDADT
jgi:hypothetical protein